MDIEKLKAEFEQSECFKKLEHVAQYTFFEFGAYLKRTDVPDNVEKKCGHLITALIFSWGAWKEAKAQAVPNGFVLVERTDLDCAIDALKWASNEDGDLCAKQAAMLESAIKAQVVSGWISVKDKLPPANILVLGMSQTRSNIFNVYNVMALDEFEEAEVTHWMRLPDAPQEPAND